MKIHKRNQIYWGELSGSSFGESKRFTFLYGSTIIYHAPDHVFFENRLIPAGRIIHEWSSLTNYQGHRLPPSLPLLQRGKDYRIRCNLLAYPRDSVFMRVIFLNHYGEEVSQIVERTTTAKFTYPKDAYSYRVQLLNAGMEYFDFYSLWIGEDKEELDD